MKIISWNVNGLKSVLRKDFLNWIEDSKAEIVCLQEIKKCLYFKRNKSFRPLPNWNRNLYLIHPQILDLQFSKKLKIC
jgi:exonuclease III